jgi:FlaA1/EpsC-like NDP-sugar epimerase
LSRAAERLIELASHGITWPRWQKRALVMAGDAVLCLVATWLAFSLRLGQWRFLDTWPVLRFALTAIALWLPIATWRGVYNAIFRYSGRGTLVALVLAVAAMTVPLIAIYGFWTYPGVPRTMPLLQPMLFFAMMATARIVGRYVLVDLFHSRPVHGQIRRVLVYGAGRTGQQLASSLRAEAGTQLVGFVDDDPALTRQLLDGVAVRHSDEIETIVERTGATDIMLAISGATKRRRQEIVTRLEPLHLNVLTLPPMREFMEGRVTVNELRAIQVEDLLGRNSVEPELALLEKAVRGNCVLVTGAGGSIGSEICRQVHALGARRLVLVEANEFALFAIGDELRRTARGDLDRDWPELDDVLCTVADASAITRVFERYRPETVFHAAAFKHVPLVEANPVAAVGNNVFGTLNTALAAQGSGVERFILISTDKAVRPPNVMGATKRVCEMILQALHDEGSRTVFTMVRFGNVLNSSGSVVPLFRAQIAAGGPVTVTDREVTRFFMTIPEAAQLVIQAGGLARGGEVFVLDMGDPVRIWEMAETMIHLAGLSVRDAAHPAGDIEIVEIGLRPGEKLHEELLIGDNPLPTSHPGIMQARDEMIPLAELEPVLERLRAAAAAGDEGACRTLLRTLVPTLAPDEAKAARAAKARQAPRDLPQARALIPARLPDHP